MERAKLAELRKIHYHKAGASEGWDEEVCKPKIRICLGNMYKILFGKAKIGFALIVCLHCITNHFGLLPCDDVFIDCSVHMCKCACVCVLCAC